MILANQFLKNRIVGKMALLTMIALQGLLTTQAQVVDGSQVNQMQFEIPDIPASYPGGLEAFRQYLSKKIIYPSDARRDNTEGKLFVSFVIGIDGLIESPSLRIVKSLSTSCDREALRVMSLSNTQWEPAKKNGKATRQLFIIPIEFKLGEFNQRQGDLEIVKPMKTVVIELPRKKSEPGWNVYSNTKMEKKIWRAMPGDSIEIIGWAPLLYFIKFNTGVGYIPYKALQVTTELKDLNERVIAESASWQAEIDRIDSLRMRQREQTWLPLIEKFGMSENQQKKLSENDSSELVSSPTTFLKLTSTNKSLTVGDCAIIDLSFYVKEGNKIRIQFYDLGKQLGELQQKGLRKDNCWVASNNISDIAGVVKNIGQQKYFVYTIYKASYCPYEAIPLVFESLKLDIAQIKTGNSNEIEKLITYNTKPLAIKVNQLPVNTSVTGSDLFQFTGDFALTDTILTERVRIGESAIYKVSIQGKGLTFPLLPPQLSGDGYSSTLRDEINSDTIINNTYFSKKTFTYSLIFTKAGEYDFSKKICYSFFNPRTKKVTKLSGKSKIDLIQREAVQGKYALLPTNKKNKLVILDVSQSMSVEDYSPNRLVAVEEGLINFFKSSATCDIGLIIFGGSAKEIEIKNDKSCYSEDQIRSLDRGLVNNGTAIGDAIWMGLHTLNQNNSSAGKIVLIGDGDNTAGFLTPTAVIKVALKYKVKIYTIGVGTTGMAQFGVDFHGQPQMVDNTFSDKDLKKMALATGGKYYWAKDAGSISSFLKEIF
jgi:TonB family protein